VLTGIETASYGVDLEDTRLADLLEAVDRIEGLSRVRLGSLDPSLMKPAFVERIAALRSLAPHFHLSMQSGSAAVLAAMKRKYNPKMALDGIARLRAAIPNVELTTDFIVGFPGESDVDFADTMALAREAEFLQMHVFAYSRRAGTPAAAMPSQIPKAVKKERSAALIALGTQLTQKRLERALLRPVHEVLFETCEDGMAIGHTKEFFEVCVPTARPLHGELLPVRVESIQQSRLCGQLERY
jgi:threonylcarbamoyladenosine tRNA methylthiotransferase MtaB